MKTQFPFLTTPVPGNPRQGSGRRVAGLLFACFAAIVVFLGPVRSVRALTVDEAVQEALSHRPDLAKSRAAVGAASWKRLESLSGYLPHVSADATHFLANKFVLTPFDLAGTLYQIPGIYPYSTLTFDASLTVFDGFKTLKNYQASRLQYQASEKELSRQVFQAVQEVRLRFFQSLAAKEMADVAAQNVATLTEHKESVRLRIQNGLVTKVDLLRVEARLEEAEAEQMSADDNVVLARKELARAMGLAEDERPLSGVLPEPRESDIPGDVAFQPGKRDDLEAKALRSRAAHKEAGATASFWVPSVSLFGEKQFYDNYDYEFNTSSYRDDYMVGAKLDWDLFDGGGAAARHAEDSYRADQAEADLKDALLGAPNQLDFWKRRFLYSCRLYRARLLNIQRTDESVRLSKLAYQNGTMTNSEVLDAVLEWTQAKAGSIQAQVDSLEAFQNLELAVGRTISMKTP